MKKILLVGLMGLTLAGVTHANDTKEVWESDKGFFGGLGKGNLALEKGAVATEIKGAHNDLLDLSSHCVTGGLKTAEYRCMDLMDHEIEITGTNKALDALRDLGYSNSDQKLMKKLAEDIALDYANEETSGGWTKSAQSRFGEVEPNLHYVEMKVAVLRLLYTLALKNPAHVDLKTLTNEDVS